MNSTCYRSWPVNLTFANISWVLYTSEMFQNLNVVACLVVPVGLGFLPAEAGYFSFSNNNCLIVV